MRLFETLDVLNQKDEQEKTVTVGCCFEMVTCDVTTNNGFVKMGVPREVAMNIINDQKRFKPMLIIIDMDAYNKISPD